MNTRYAISDIHGNYRTFLQALDLIQLSPSDELYLLGDYVDRGPGSRQVIRHILKLQREGYRLHCLRGNHEQYMLNAMSSDDPDVHLHWIRAGGGTTLDSYRLSETELYEDVDHHCDWMNGLPYYLDSGEYLFVHAGLNFQAVDPLLDKDSLIQERRWYDNINYDWLGDRIVVHGHTPIVREEIAQQADPTQRKHPAFNIDAGCFHWREGFGHLCVMDLDRREFKFLANADMDLAAIRAERSRYEA